MRPKISYATVVFTLLIVASIVATVYWYRVEHSEAQLNTEDARITALIRHLLYDENGSATKIYWTPAMEELVEIGSPAVPKLIEAIETAHEKAASVEFVGVERSKWGITYDTEMIQTRSAMVLGRIGDVRALVILTTLKCHDERLMCKYVNDALDSLQKKARDTNSKTPGRGLA